MPFSRFVPFAFGLAAGIGAGAATIYVWQKTQVRQSMPEGKHRALKYGIPRSERLLLREGFVISYDTRLRNPQWVLEHITRDNSLGLGNRKNVEFFEDRELEERFRSKLSDFRGSGYDRGHLAPAANHKGSQKAMTDTFVLSNICPQVGKGFNRDYWARFERFVKQLTHSYDEVYVISGPLYLPQRTPQGFLMQHPMIGEPPCLVAVPTHFYKVILGESPAGSGSEGTAKLPVTSVAAFVMPNAAIEPDLPLTTFAVPLEALESVSGLHFFPALISPERRGFHDQLALSWQAQGRVQMLSQQQRRQPALPPGHQGEDLRRLEDTHLATGRPAPQTAEADAAIAAKELPIGLLDKSPAAQDLSSLPSRVEDAAPEDAAPQLETLRHGANPAGGVRHEASPARGLLHRDAATATSLNRSKAAPASSSSLSKDVSPTHTPSEAKQSSPAAAGGGLWLRPEAILAVPGPRQSQANAEDSQPGTVIDDEFRAKGAAELGIAHLCDRVQCRLPPTDWWVSRKNVNKQLESS